MGQVAFYHAARPPSWCVIDAGKDLRSLVERSQLSAEELRSNESIHDLNLSIEWNSFLLWPHLLPIAATCQPLAAQVELAAGRS